LDELFFILFLLLIFDLLHSITGSVSGHTFLTGGRLCVIFRLLGFVKIYNKNHMESRREDDMALSQETDREGVSLEKFLRSAKLILGDKIDGADAFLDRFTDFDVEALRDLTRKRLLSVLVDVDDCIAPIYSAIPDANLAHVEGMLSFGVGVGVYSNCKGMDRLAPLREMGVQIYSGKFAKPSSKGFLEACANAGFDPRSTWMIGDNPITDGGAVGVLEGMAFVRPIDPPVEMGRLTLRKAISLPFSRCLRGIATGLHLEDNDRLVTSYDVHNWRD
jgi:predicted HAD superfamily phosphohydrolase YqeG